MTPPEEFTGFQARASGPQSAGKKNPSTSPIGILKILQCSNLGGMEQVTYSLLQNLASSGEYRFHITTPRPFGKGEAILRDFDPSCRDSRYRGKYGWRSFRGFRQHLRRLTEETRFIWVTGTCACSLAAIRNIPYKKVLSHHFHHFGDRTAPLRWFGFYHTLCRKLDVITYPTEFSRNEALRIAPWLRDRAHVVRNGCPVTYFGETDRLHAQAQARRSLDLPTEAYIIGNAGWLIPRKRFDIFLHTASRIKKKFPRAFFVICGGGPLEKDLRDLTESLGLSNCVRFTGWVENLSLHYKAWDLCLFNSDLDALGRTPIEAASHGCLIAASVLRGGLSEFLVNGENSIFMTTHDGDALTNRIVDLAKDPVTATRFREASAEKLVSKYSVEESVHFFRSIFA